MATLVPRETDKCIILAGNIATWIKLEVTYKETKSKWMLGQQLETYATTS